jgi:hypothetical protein
MLHAERIGEAQALMRAHAIDAYLILTHDDYRYFFGVLLWRARDGSPGATLSRRMRRVPAWIPQTGRRSPGASFGLKCPTSDRRRIRSDRSEFSGAILPYARRSGEGNAPMVFSLLLRGCREGA